ncbi:MAG: DUF3124 domain-containing protein [Anaerolineales bacterium]|nr:DUF3124 domain-containing protein [Anaerolineales bacterium]
MSALTENMWIMRQVIASCIGFMLPLVLLFLASCTSPENGTETTLETSVPLTDLDITTGQTIYVPAYSEMYIERGRIRELAVTLTIHNTDIEQPIILTSVRYYDTQGQLLKEHLSEPRQLGPLASTDFFVDASEQSGGLGTNFIVEWVAEQPVFEPVVEAIMINTSNNLGISLTTPGRVINQIAPGDN